MEIFGKVQKVVLAREGVAKMSGNHYQIHNVVVAGSDNVVFEVYGTAEHLQKHGMVEGAEGKFTIKTEVNEYQGRIYQRMSMMDISRDFVPLVSSQPKPAEPKTEAQLQHEAMAEAAQAAKTETKPAETQAPQPNDDLPF